MDTNLITLTTEEYERLNSLYPDSAGSGLIGKRAEEIVKIYFQRTSPGCTFAAPDAGADLTVLFCDGSSPSLIEVKGTAALGIAWPQLKVSSQQSYNLLVQAGVPVYRVSGVFTATPTIYVLRHGADFRLEEEARWAFKRSGAGGQAADDEAVELGEGTATTHGPQMSKYDVLREYLEQQGGELVTLAFMDAPDVLGFSLPPSASRYQAFWANQTDTTNRPWARAWQSAGYRVEAHRLTDDGWVRFRRIGPKP